LLVVRFGDVCYTTNEGAPYLAFFWRDVGFKKCWRESACRA
jgi:hypothetical protein